MLGSPLPLCDTPSPSDLFRGEMQQYNHGALLPDPAWSWETETAKLVEMKSLTPTQTKAAAAWSSLQGAWGKAIGCWKHLRDVSRPGQDSLFSLAKSQSDLRLSRG